MMKTKKITIILLLAVIVGGLAQLIKPESLNKYVAAERTEDLAGVPKEVNDILKNACFNCHSSSPQLEWFDNITPANFFVASHIEAGTEALNFSEWADFPDSKQKAILFNSINKIRAGEMPLRSYTLAHPEARIKENQKKAIENYLTSITSRKTTDSLLVKTVQTDHNKNLPLAQLDYKKVKPAPNGIAYIPDYRNWKAISTTDRFDNGTMRIVFANDVAVAAIKAKQTNPWPDGSILAKVAWEQEIAADGKVSTGKFVQVEYMIKDAKKYAKTTGWGWARWKGEDLRPYGKTVSFATECISCHKPVSDNDNVFTMPLNLK